MTHLNFYLANDLGRNGYYDQKTIDELMGEMAETVDTDGHSLPLIRKYRKDAKHYPDAGWQDDREQLAWIGSVLNVAQDFGVLVAAIIPSMRQQAKAIPNGLAYKKAWSQSCGNIRM